VAAIPAAARSGTIRWRGTVDDVVELNIQGGDIDPRAISGTPIATPRWV
jgi:hypothetical protein